MTKPITHARSSLPHHKLVAYEVACQLVGAVHAARVRDPHLSEQARRAAARAALNIAEAAGRVSAADKARVFAIARGEVSEAAAAIEIAALQGSAAEAAAQACIATAARLVALLTGLIRR